jgi:hypothetical protein
MNFQSAVSLLWLLPLGGIIFALYLLRMRRKDVHVPSTFLWPERTDEVRANALFQRLRFSWLLVLQLLALTLFVLAVARPQTLQKGLAGETTVVVLDASASMGATDVEPSRFDEAVRVVEGMVASANPGDQIMLIEAGPYPRVVFPLSSDPAAQRRALGSVRRSDAPSDVEEALRLATARVGEIDGAKIVLLSDGVFEEVENFASGKASLVYSKIGQDRNNVAIEALGSTQGPDGRVVYCGVKNHALDEQTVEVVVTADGETINAQTAKIASNKTWGATFPAPPGAKVIEARIRSNDILDADDYAVTVVDPGASLRVLLVSRGDIFLERALALDPRVTLDKASQVPEGERAGSAGPGTYDVVVFDGIKESPVKARGVLTFGAAGPPSPVTPSGRSRTFEFLRAEQHDLMRGVDLRNVYIENVEKVEPKPAGRVLADGRSGPLIVAAEAEKRQVYVAFSPLDSDFPLTVGFPIFVANSLDYLAGSTVSDSFAILAGQQFQLPAESAEPATLSRPDGSEVQVEPLQGRYIVSGVDQVGTYSVETPQRKVTVYANMRDDLESSVNSQDFVSIKKQRVTAAKDLRRYADFWKPLALLALLVLAAEWWMYARRS